MVPGGKRGIHESTDRAVYVQAADLVPITVCPREISWSRRDRLYWIDLKILEEKGVILTPGNLCHELDFMTSKPVRLDLLDHGCSK